MAIRPFHILSGLLLCCAASGSLHAAELGEARVLSHIGQPLAAEVELTTVEDAGHAVQARLARPDVYRGANIVMPPALSGLDIAVIRQGGKQFLRLASLKPVESKHLHVYLELVDGGQRSVRLVTLWLTPDPSPAPAPAPVVVAPVVAAAAAAAAPAPAPVAAAPEPVKAAEPAPVRKPAPPKRRPPPNPVPAQAEPEAHAAEADHAAPAPKRAAAKPVEKPVADPGKPAPACAPAPARAEPAACAVLGAKNDALRQELGQLEDKVKVLQVAAGVKSASQADAETVAQAKVESDASPHAGPDAKEEDKKEDKAAAKADDKPKSAPRIHRKPKTPPPPEEPMPWLAIGGVIAGLLVLAGLAVLLRRRRAAARGLKTAREPEVVVLPQEGGADGAQPKPSLMSVVKARLMAVRLGKRPAPAARVEPEAADATPPAQPEQG